MRLWTHLVSSLGLAFVIGTIALAAPPGEISGPAPLGASGPAPLGASGSLIATSQRGAGFGRGGSGRRPGGVNRNPANGRSGYINNSRRYPAAFFFAPYYDSFGDYGSSPYDSAYGPDPGPDPGVENFVQSQGQLRDQVQRLTGEVEALREQNQGANPYPSQQAPSPAAVPVTLVLHNGQKLQVQNYAIMDGVFWDFSKEPARKIPISAIDVPASERITQDNGGEFPELNGTPQAGN